MIGSMVVWLSTCNGRGFQSKRFHDLETALKTTRFRRVYGTYPTVNSNRLCQGDLVLRREKYLQGASPHFISQRKIPKRHSSKSLTMKDSRTIYLRTAGVVQARQHFVKTFSRHLCLLLRYASRFIESKIHESCKSEVKPRIKVVIVQQNARFTIFTSRASQFRARPFLNRCGFAVYTTNETVSFWKRFTFQSVFKTTRFW